VRIGTGRAPIRSMRVSWGEAGTDHEKRLISVQIEQSDRAIDALVYDLYDLAPEEIAIVEGRA